MRRYVLSVSIYSGDAGHSLMRQNCHKDPARPVYPEWSPWFVIQVSTLAFIGVLDVILILSL